MFQSILPAHILPVVLRGLANILTLDIKNKTVQGQCPADSFIIFLFFLHESTWASNNLFPAKSIPGVFLAGWQMPRIEKTSIRRFSQWTFFMNKEIALLCAAYRCCCEIMLKIVPGDTLYSF